MAQTAAGPPVEVTPEVAILPAAPTLAGEDILVAGTLAAVILAAVAAPMVANGMRRMTKRSFR